MKTKLWTDKQLEAMEFKPQKVGDKYIAFLIEYSQCYKCKKDMIKRPKNPTRIFPYWLKINFDAQIKMANFVIRSDVLVDDHFICIECVEAGEADFLCALCETRKPTNKIQDWYGDPAEFLCSDCFCSVTAATWRAKANELCEAHRYDHE